MSFSVDVGVATLVDFQHAKHAYNIHKSCIYNQTKKQKKFYLIGELYFAQEISEAFTELIVGVCRAYVVTGTEYSFDLMGKKKNIKLIVNRENKPMKNMCTINAVPIA